jgi:hypothetical protein
MTDDVSCTVTRRESASAIDGGISGGRESRQLGQLLLEKTVSNYPNKVYWV